MHKASTQRDSRVVNYQMHRSVGSFDLSSHLLQRLFGTDIRTVIRYQNSQQLEFLFNPCEPAGVGIDQREMGLPDCEFSGQRSAQTIGCPSDNRRPVSVFSYHHHVYSRRRREWREYQPAVRQAPLRLQTEYSVVQVGFRALWSANEK